VMVTRKYTIVLFCSYTHTARNDTNEKPNTQRAIFKKRKREEKKRECERKRSS
jgi:hypothetical protein